MKKFTKIFLCLLVISLVASMAVALTACKEKTSLTGIKFEDGVLSWDKDSIVGSAVDSYKAFVNGVEKKIDLSENGKKLSVNLGEETSGDKDFDVTVKAKGDDVEVDQTITFRKLPTAVVKVENGTFDWTESAQAYSQYGEMIYDIILDGKRISSVIDTKYKATTGVAHSIVVRPRVSGDNAYYFASWSEEVQATVLSTPIISDVEWTVLRDNNGDPTSAKAEITWTSPSTIANVQYIGTINGIEFVTDKASLNTDTIEGLDVKDGFAISLKAKSNEPAISDSSLSEVRRFISLGKPQNLRVVDGVLRFDEVRNAAFYKVEGKAGAASFNGETTTTSYVLEDAADTFKIKVTARPAEGYEATENPSEEISFNILGQPGIRFVSKAFFIDGVTDNVKAYDIRIEKDVDVDGNIEKQVVYTTRQDVLNKIFNQYDFKEEGRYWISVKAVAKEGSQYMDSQYSDAYEVVRLGTIPGLTIEEIPAVEKVDESQGGEPHASYLRVTVDKLLKNPDLVTRYQLYMDNTEISTTSKLTFDIPAPTTYNENAYKFSVRAISDDNGSPTRVVLSSYYAVDFYATKMSTPRNITLNDEGSVSWDMPASQFEYLQMSGDNTKYNDNLADFQVVIAYTSYTANRDSRVYPFPANLDSGLYYVNVYARSKFSKKNSAKNECVELKFDVDADGNTTVYAIDKENAPENVTAKATDGKSIVVLSSDYSNSETMIRLATPVTQDFVIEDNTLEWPAVEGAYGYDIFYATTVDGEAKFGKIATVEIGTNFVFDDINLASADDPDAVQSLLASEDGCLINIVAIGNRGKDLRNGEIYSYDSKPSDNLAIFKLDRPTGISVNNSYITWNAVPYATGYRVFDGNGDSLLMGTQEVRTNSLSITDLPGDFYNITIQAIGDGKQYFDSERSDNFIFHKLAPMSVERVGDVYAWPMVEYALNYELTIDGITYSVEAKTADRLEDGRYYYKPTFRSINPAGLVVQYRAVASNGTVMDWEELGLGYEKYDYPVIAGESGEFRQPVIQANTPVFKTNGELNYRISSTYERFYVEANIGDLPNENYTYKYQIGGKDFYSDTKEFTYKDAEYEGNPIQTGKYTVSVAYGANFFDEEGNYVVDSNYASTTQDFTFLRGTTGYVISFAGKKVNVSWNAVTGASAYRYFYTIYTYSKDKLGLWTVGEAVYTSTVENTVGQQSSFTIDDLETVMGDAYVSGTKYAIQVSVVTLGDDNAVSAYDVAISGISSIN